MSEVKFEVLSTQVICREPGRYIGWPTVVRTKDDELIAGFSGDRDQHVCPWGVTQLVRSQDGGATWSAPETITNTPLDDRDVGIIETPEGALLVAWFTSVVFAEPERQAAWREHYGDETVDGWAERIAAMTPELENRWLGNWTRRSEDGGKTWSEPARTIGTAPHGPNVLSDGRLLYVGRGRFRGEPVISVEESRDDGRSWQLISTIAIAADESIDDFHEPHVVETADGKLVAMIRYQPKDRQNHYMRQAESADGGYNWTEAHATNLYGLPPHLLCLENGYLVVVYGRRIPPFGERAAISRDGGATWEGDFEISSGMNGDLGYPASTQLADGSILTVYYQIAEEGQKTSLMSTRWRLL